MSTWSYTGAKFRTQVEIGGATHEQQGQGTRSILCSSTKYLQCVAMQDRQQFGWQPTWQIDRIFHEPTSCGAQQHSQSGCMAVLAQLQLLRIAGGVSSTTHLHADPALDGEDNLLHLSLQVQVHGNAACTARFTNGFERIIDGVDVLDDGADFAGQPAAG